MFRNIVGLVILMFLLVGSLGACANKERTNHVRQTTNDTGNVNNVNDPLTVKQGAKLGNNYGVRLNSVHKDGNELVLTVTLENKEPKKLVISPDLFQLKNNDEEQLDFIRADFNKDLAPGKKMEGTLTYKLTGKAPYRFIATSVHSTADKAEWEIDEKDL
ncbi:DUF4352 domain-containing protein [Heyndrickxia coagulans]|uniref:DUF4352 domain-containing protein n=1 Tax=Heyndrickxia coagulans DSM 1 = ATCC 7050 TaxID=1121088 RepID=A0A8B4BYN5_HEYCO|nr:DUF4352 domain-containing protein [Heyndrickxia coagulans]AJH76994.1 hypothetical protein BF29_2154 [Heyndrickxia coagulans DSM 1 = ATCC 7050]MCR2846907.1 DUF4352 domain-containing protein [Heyndrickxia coagulans]MDR4224486.1 DUF4352 domain-containing protein [Heyndrickxia coagulans DSM 1 = ATCC 7050]MED4345412.1 DUF4352 domain-containing protein [Heyndrickxia coagulans]MED4495300.1 DUF4352 domain-containing protein [Heyndrickxia coagulans]